MQLKKIIKGKVPTSVISLIQNYFLFPIRIKKWKLQGRIVPPPSLVKQMAVKQYQRKYKCNILVETGTFLGEMIEFQKNNFNKIFSIELDDALYKRAKEIFHKFDHIELIHGDSAKALKGVVEKLDEPAIFWLDAHYSGGISAKGEKVSPILDELEIIFNKNFEHIILIDDARLFKRENDYPEMQEVINFIKNKNNNYIIEKKDDILRVAPY